VSEDKATAALMGINVDRSIVMTFALGAAMAGAGGVLFGLLFRNINFFSGFIPGLKAFTSAVLGGIGNIPGAMLGGMFLGRSNRSARTLFLTGLACRRPTS
jgi:branched-chain amino acid transport system permease protein